MATGIVPLCFKKTDGESNDGVFLFLRSRNRGMATGILPLCFKKTKH